MKNLLRNLKMKSPALLIAGGCVGIFLTAYSVFKETPKYLEITEKKPKMGKIERSKAILRVYWPSIALGVGSGACFIGAHTIDVRRQAALAGSLAVTETALMEFKDAAKNTLGEKAISQIEEKISEDKVKENPTSEEMVTPQYEYRPGEVLFLEPYSGQHFWSTVETVRQAEIEMIEMCHGNMWASMNDFFDEIDSPQLHRMLGGDEIGWNAEHPMRISSISTIEEKPGLIVYVINYRELPRTEYADLHGPMYGM